MPTSMRLSLLWVLLAAVPCVAKPKPPPPPPPPRPTAPTAQVLANLSERVLSTLTTANKVQAWRVASSEGLRPDPAKAIGSDFTREAPGAVLEGEPLQTLRGVLYDDKSYRFQVEVAGCSFKPNVGFHFEQGLDVVEVVVSFSCNQALFYVGKPGGRWLPSGTFDVKPARAVLLTLAKAALPDDPVTQRLR